MINMGAIGFWCIGRISDSEIIFFTCMEELEICLITLFSFFQCEKYLEIQKMQLTHGFSPI